MSMFERILIPLDGSPRSEAVLGHVAAILRRQDSEVVALRVVPAPAIAQGQANPFVAEEEGIAEAYVQELVRRLIDEGIRARPIVERGSPATAILDVAQREKITLTALATHGRSGLTRWTLGSVTEKVIRASAGPVLVLRSFRADTCPIPLGPLAFRLLLVPISRGFLRAVPFVTEFAKLFQSRVALLHVVEGREGAEETRGLRGELEAVARTLHEGQVPSEILIREGGDPAREIVETCREIGADMIALSTHGREGLSRWALGSVTEKVLRAATVPMLIVRNA